MRTIAHISDIHFGRIDLNIAEKLATFLHELKPDLLIVSGDLTQRARAGQFKAAAEYLKRLPTPRLIVPGNHDVPLYDLTRRIFAPLQLYRRYITDDLLPVYSDDELLVIGMNSTRSFSPRMGGFWKDGRLRGEQLAQIEPILAAAKPTQTKIVVTHHPFIPAPGGDPTDLIHAATVALPIFARLGVDLLLAGHLHRSYGGDVRVHHTTFATPLLSVQAGTATSTRLRGVPNAFNLFRIEPDRMELLVHHFDGVTFVADEPQHFLRDTAGWHAAQ